MIRPMDDDLPRRPKPPAETLRASISKVLRARGVPEQDIEDRCQAVFLEVEQSRNVPAAEPARTQYIHGIARNEARKHRKGSAAWGRQEPYDEEDLPVGVAPTPHDEIDLARRLHAAAEARDPQAAEWLVRAKVHGESETGIAKEHGIPVNRVRKRISRLTATLRESSRSLGVGAAILVLALFAGRWLMTRGEAVESSPRPTQTGETSAPPAPEGRTAQELRRAALEACKAERWALCVHDLDEARRLDPAGEDRPEVRAARQAAAGKLRGMGDGERK